MQIYKVQMCLLICQCVDKCNIFFVKQQVPLCGLCSYSSSTRTALLQQQSVPHSFVSKPLTHLEAVHQQIVVTEGSRSWRILHEAAYTLVPYQSYDWQAETRENDPIEGITLHGAVVAVGISLQQPSFIKALHSCLNQDGMRQARTCDSGWDQLTHAGSTFRTEEHRKFRV
jgi:hypothetical protein